MRQPLHDLFPGVQDDDPVRYFHNGFHHVFHDDQSHALIADFLDEIDDCRSSTAVSPAMDSSSIRSRGCSARAMETSSRFLSAMVSSVPKKDFLSMRPVKIQNFFGLFHCRPDAWCKRMSAPVTTFSRTVMSLITWTIWKVRAMPSLQIRSARNSVDIFSEEGNLAAVGLIKTR